MGEVASTSKGGFGLATAGIVVLVAGVLLDVVWGIGLSDYQAQDLNAGAGVITLLQFQLLPTLGLGLCYAARRRDIAAAGKGSGLSATGVVAGWVTVTLASMFGLYFLWFASGGAASTRQSGMDDILKQMQAIEQEEKAKKRRQ